MSLPRGVPPSAEGRDRLVALCALVHRDVNKLPKEASRTGASISRRPSIEGFEPDRVLASIDTVLQEGLLD